MNIICEYGCGNNATHQFKSKKWCCSSSPSSCPEMKRKNSAAKKGKYPFEGKEHPRGMKGKTHTFKGKSYEEIYGVERASEVKSKIQKANTGKKQNSHLTDEQKIELSEQKRNTINKRYEDGWMPKAGRCKKYQYESPIAGVVSLDGTWEVETAKILDALGVVWTRNIKRFKYIHLNGKESHYTPDFWVEDWNSYLEVKGYETPLDRCKWEQFKNNLIIWRKEDIFDK